MKRFQFRLQKVLSLRTQETDQARRALAVAIALEAEARRELQRASAALQSRLSQLQSQEFAGMSGFDFGNLRTHIRLLQSRVEAARAQLTALEERTALRRMGLLEARRKERALERLREKRLEAYTEESFKAEQKELDEFGDRLGLNTGLSRSEI